MVLIGFMHHRKMPTNKAYAFAVVAKAEGAELLYFSPGAVDFQNRKITGYKYFDGEWKRVTSVFPDVICNVTGFNCSKQNQIVDRLGEEIPFTSFPIGSKYVVYKNIMQQRDFSNYLVPSAVVSSVEHFFSLLDKYKEIVFKPSVGSQGRDVYYFKKEDYNPSISDFISEKILCEEYIIQPYINCRTKSGNSYDIRLHVQKNASGKWVIGKIYPRIAEGRNIVCNLSQGSYTCDLTAFLKREFGKGYFNMQRSMEGFALQLAATMDKVQKERYNEELDELGIDIGIDENKKIWIYEINWRPGYPPSMNLDLNIVKNMIQYAVFLAKKRLPQGENTNENDSFYRNK